MSSIKKNLRRLRGELDLTQKEFAKLIDMPLSTYRKKEKGETNFTIEEAYTIANAVSKIGNPKTTSGITMASTV